MAITKKSFAIQSIARAISADNAQSLVWHVANSITMPKTRRHLYWVKMCLSHRGSTMTINVGMWVSHASAQKVPIAWSRARYSAPTHPVIGHNLLHHTLTESQHVTNFSACNFYSAMAYAAAAPLRKRV